MAYKRRRKLTKKQKRKMILEGVILFLAFVGAGTLLSMTVNGVKRLFGKTGAVDAPQIDEQLLTVNEYSRPGIALGKINGIVVHYTANPGTGAQANRNYFEGLKDSHETKVSSHFVIGLNGEITAWLCGEYGLTTEDVIRHYDVTGKDCPKYYVEHPEAWERFLADVDAYMEQNGK